MESFDENDQVKRQFTIHVYHEVVVKEFENHIRISKRDWDRLKRRLIPVLKQEETGDMNHATGNE